MKGLDSTTIELLEANIEFVQLNAWIQQAIQTEIMKGVKARLNVNPEVISKVSRAKDIIQEIKNNQEAEDRNCRHPTVHTQHVQPYEKQVQLPMESQRRDCLHRLLATQ
jgi:hypothetical protein